MYMCLCVQEEEENGDPPLFYRSCTSAGGGIWLPIILVVKGVILAIGTFLAFELRNVNIKELTESKLIPLAIYSAGILYTATIFLVFLLPFNVAALYGTVGGLILVTMAFHLAVLFIPKVHVTLIA